MAKQRTVVAGGGALGLSLALALAREGHDVSLCEQGQFGDNASGMAAGMLAPAMESVLDPASRGHFDLLIAARSAWPAFAADFGLPVEGDGAALVGTEAFVSPLAAQLQALGVPLQGIDDETMAKVAPGAAMGIYTPIDWRIDPVLALASLKAAGEGAGVRMFGQGVIGFEPGSALLAGGASLPADHLVVATGYSHDLANIAPELNALTPIKGQLVHLPRGAQPPCVLRGEGVYVCPAARGIVVGATMEPGKADRQIDVPPLDALLERAKAINPDMVRGPAQGRAGVRAGTPDGLPLVGRGGRKGVWIATGARRNGWLLAPLVAEVLPALMRGESAPFAERLRPDRFVAA